MSGVGADDLGVGAAGRAASPGPSGSSRPSSTPGTLRAAVAAPSGIGEKPSLFWITRPPAKFSSTTWATELFSPAAKTVTKATRARPIISAAAVTAVRLGLRCAFSRARRPVSRRSALQRPAGDRGQRRHQARAEERDGDDDRRPRRRRSAPARGAGAAAAEEADQDQRQAGEAEQRSRAPR